MAKKVFVVLHYETLDDTAKCIDSLLKYTQSGESSIVVVDNGSKTGTIDKISGKYDESKVHFIRSEENLGFARGNNLGYVFAKQQLSADIIVLTNNDTVFEQTDFDTKLDEYASSLKFDVAGPKIISLADAKNQNPVPVLYPDEASVKTRIFKYRVLYFLSLFGLDNAFRRIFASEIQEFSPSADEDFQLHGACLIFANRYVELFDGLYDGTFMYMEESILKQRCVQNNLKMCYLNDITVYHKEGSSTSSTIKKAVKKRRFFYYWNLAGCKILAKMMRDKGNN